MEDGLVAQTGEEGADRKSATGTLKSSLGKNAKSLCYKDLADELPIKLAFVMLYLCDRHKK